MFEAIVIAAAAGIVAGVVGSRLYWNKAIAAGKSMLAKLQSDL